MGTIPMGFDDDLSYERRLAIETIPRVHKGATALREAAKAHTDRVKLAAASHIPQTKKKYGLTKTNEADLAKVIRGSTSNNQNEPFDVYAGKHAIEVKTIQASGHDRITMHPSSLKAKLKAARKGGFTAHTVVFDTRKGKEAVYYREGIGSFRLAQMRKLPSIESIREAIGMDESAQQFSPEMKHATGEPAQEVIPKTGSGYQVKSEKGKNLSSPGLSKGQAKKRLAQVEYFKHKKESALPARKLGQFAFGKIHAMQHSEGGPGSGPRSEAEIAHRIAELKKQMKSSNSIERKAAAAIYKHSYSHLDPDSSIKDVAQNFLDRELSKRGVHKEESRKGFAEAGKKFLKYLHAAESETARIKEAGVKGMKWGVRKDTPSVTILMGTNGSGKTTVIKSFVKRYDGKQVDINGQKLTQVTRKGDSALIMGHYTDPKFLSGEENAYRNSGKMRRAGKLYETMDAAIDKAKEMGVKSLILDSKQFAYGKGPQEVADYCKKNGIALQAVRVKAPLATIVQRVADRIDPGHRRDRTLRDIASQHARVKKTYNGIKEGGWKVLKITNGEKTKPMFMAKKLGNFVFKGQSHSEAATKSKPNLREHGGDGTITHPLDSGDYIPMVASQRDYVVGGEVHANTGFFESVKRIHISNLHPTQKLGYKRKQISKAQQNRVNKGEEKLPPIKVRKNKKSGKYDILDGHHRFLMARKAGHSSMTAEEVKKLPKGINAPKKKRRAA